MGIAGEAARRIQSQLLLYGVVQTALVLAALTLGTDVPSGWRPIIYAVALLFVLVPAGHFVIEYRDVARARGVGLPATIPVVGRPRALTTFALSDSREFRDRAEEAILAASRVTMIGTGLNVLHHEPFVDLVMQRASRRECNVEIYLADPRSPDVELRLAEEELGNPKPSVGRAGLEARLASMLRQWEDIGSPDTVSIRLFRHYPTYAVIAADLDYFAYPYGYSTLGNFSPVIHVTKDDPENAGFIKFFDDQYRRVRDDSVDAKLVHDLRARPWKPVVKPDELVAAAIFYIPPEHAALYEQGSRILGFDLYQRRELPTKWQDEVGDAIHFGFHMTIADVLYFLTARDRDMAIADLQMACADLQPFSLRNLRVEGAVPDARSVSVVGDDDSGTLEILHHEAVQRFYRRAVASNYSLGLAPATRDANGERARLMIHRYRAPYILKRYRPHLTLLTNVEPERQPEVAAELAELVESEVEPTIRVDRLAVMTRSRTDGRWAMANDLLLG